MLGDAMAIKMMTSGMLSQLLCQLLHRLGPRLRDRALEYWGGVIRDYSCEGPTRDAMPAQFREHLDTALHHQHEVGQLGPSVSRLAGYNGLLDTAFDQLSHVTAVQGIQVQILHVPEDLYWVAPSCVLLTHWRPFIRYMYVLGGYTRSLQPPPSDIFSMISNAAATMANHDHDDGVYDE